MVEEHLADLGPGPARLKTLTQILLDRIAEHLEEEAHRHGGALDGPTLRAAIEKFRDSSDHDAQEFYRAGWNECLSVIDEVRRETSRRLPFERMMVHPLALLLPAAHETVAPGKNLSRRIIPGFLTAIHQMLGPVLLEQYQNRCRELVRIIETARGRDFEWADVYKDPTSQVIVNDVLVHISKHFGNFERRKTWMMGAITSQMPLGENETERRWVFGDAEFSMLMEALFRPLRNEMSTPDGEQRIKDRYGAIACDPLTDFFADLDASGGMPPLRQIAP